MSSLISVKKISKSFSNNKKISVLKKMNVKDTNFLKMGKHM